MVSMRQFDTSTGKIIYRTDTGKIAEDCGGAAACMHCTSTPQYVEVQFAVGTGIGTAAIGSTFQVGPGLAQLTCPTCESIEGTYVIEQFTDCAWRAEFCHCNLDAFTTAMHVNVSIFLSGSDYILECKFSIRASSSITGTATYRKNLGTTKPDCTTWSGEELTYVSDANTGCTGWSNGKVRITAHAGPADDDNKPCPYCRWPTSPSQWKARIVGALSDSTCDCSDTGGQVTLAKITPTALIDTCCRWEVTYVAGDACSWNYQLTIGNNGLISLAVRIDASVAASYQTTTTDVVDCADTYQLPHVSGTPAQCTGWAGTTIELISA